MGLVLTMVFKNAVGSGGAVQIVEENTDETTTTTTTQQQHKIVPPHIHNEQRTKSYTIITKLNNQKFI